jgi:carbonic anhydrase
MLSYDRLLLENKAWAAEMVADDPQFFTNLAKLQSPEFLWIGCSDSRVPANQITGTQPGEIFVHRNVANLVVSSDLNMLAVLDYAVNHLKVKHVIVCGHYGCGGIQAAASRKDYKPVLNMWLRNIKDVYFKHEQELNAIGDDTARADRLTELNVMEQVKNLARKSSIQRAWKNEQRPDLHGWVYSLKDGLIRSIFDMKAGSEIESVYEIDDL